MMRLVLAACIVLALVSASVVAGPVVRAETVWGTPEQVSDADAFAWFPESHSDATGATRLVWESTLPGEDGEETDTFGTLIHLTQLQADDWSDRSAILIKDVHNAGRPIIASDGRYLHMLVRYVPPDKTITNQARLYYSRAPIGNDPSNAHAWSEPVPLSVAAAYWAHICLLPDGSIVVVYNQIVSAPEGNEIPLRTATFSRRSPDAGATWETPVRLSQNDGFAARTSLAATPDGYTLVAAWDLGYDNMIGQGVNKGFELATSIDGGRTWAPAVTFAGESQQVTVANNGETFLLVYRSAAEDVLLYRTSADEGATWSDESTIGGVIPRPYLSDHHFDKLSLAVDGVGRYLLAYVGVDPDAPSGLSVFVTSFAEGEWATPERIASPDGYPEYPRLAVALGNQIHVVYFVRDDLWETREASIWVVSGQSDAAPVAPADIEPAVRPTPTPRPTPEPVVLATLPTPLPDPSPVPPSSVGNPDLYASIYAPLALIGGSTGVLLLVILVVFALTRLPLRSGR